MRALYKMALLCGLFVIPNSTTARETATSDSFSGVWTVSVEPDDNASQAGKQIFTDMILFEEGQLSASACASYGFSSSAYELSENGAQFSATMRIEGESIQWTGQLVSGRLHGEVLWSKADGSVYHYTMSGSRDDTSHGQSQN